jgi:hypothetical protein
MRHLNPWLLRAGFSEQMFETHFLEFGQGMQSMSPALRDLEQALLDGHLAHGDHPVLGVRRQHHCGDRRRMQPQALQEALDRKDRRPGRAGDGDRRPGADQAIRRGCSHRVTGFQIVREHGLSALSRI